MTVPVVRISIFPAPEFVALMPPALPWIVMDPMVSALAADWSKSMPPAPVWVSENAIPDVSTLELAAKFTERVLPAALRVWAAPITAPLQVKAPLPCEDSKHPFRKMTSFLPASRGVTV